MNRLSINSMHDYIFKCIPPQCSQEANLQSPIVRLVKDVVRYTDRSYSSSSDHGSLNIKKQLSKCQIANKDLSEKLVRDGIIENMASDNKFVEETFNGFFASWLKHKNLSINDLTIDEIAEEKKDALYDLSIRGLGFDKIFCSEKLSANCIIVSKMPENFDAVVKMDALFKKLIASDKVKKWGSVKMPLYRGSDDAGLILERNILKNRPAFNMGSVNVCGEAYGKGLYVSGQIDTITTFIHSTLMKIEISDNTPYIQLSECYEANNIKDVIAKELGIYNHETGCVNQDHLNTVDTYIKYYSKEPIIVDVNNIKTYFLLKSPYIITGITTTGKPEGLNDIQEIEKIERNFPEAISVQQLENGTHGPIKGRTSHFKKTLSSEVDTNKTTMVARGYWNAKQEKAEDLPLLSAMSVTKPTIPFDRSIYNKKDHENYQYFVQSPEDKKYLWSAKKSIFDDKVYILEPEQKED